MASFGPSPLHQVPAHFPPVPRPHWLLLQHIRPAVGVDPRLWFSLKCLPSGSAAPGPGRPSKPLLTSRLEVCVYYYCQLGRHPETSTSALSSFLPFIRSLLFTYYAICFFLLIFCLPFRKQAEYFCFLSTGLIVISQETRTVLQKCKW